MKLETKYDIGQSVWFIKDNRIHKSTIYGLVRYSINYTSGGKYQEEILYDLNSLGQYYEKDLHSTKEDLIKAIS